MSSWIHITWYTGLAISAGILVGAYGFQTQNCAPEDLDNCHYSTVTHPYGELRVWTCYIKEE